MPRWRGRGRAQRGAGRLNATPGWLYAPTGRLRAVWRLTLYALTVFASGIVALQLAYPLLSGVASSSGIRLNAWYGFPFSDWLTLLALVLAHVVMVKWIEKRAWADVWLGRAAIAPSRLALGTVFGALAIAVPTLLLLGGQMLRIEPGVRGSWAGTSLSLFGRLLPAAAIEEFFFRGYPFLVLREGLGTAAALGITSVTFGLVHAGNPGANPLSLAMVVIAGFFLGAVLLVTGSLWAAIAAHVAWNWTLAAVLHTAVSGLPLPMPDYRLVDAGPDWLTGGAWGPEGGVAAGLGMLSALALLRRRHARNI